MVKAAGPVPPDRGTELGMELTVRRSAGGKNTEKAGFERPVCRFTTRAGFINGNHDQRLQGRACVYAAIRPMRKHAIMAHLICIRVKKWMKPC